MVVVAKSCLAGFCRAPEATQQEIALMKAIPDEEMVQQILNDVALAAPSAAGKGAKGGKGGKGGKGRGRGRGRGGKRKK